MLVTYHWASLIPSQVCTRMCAQAVVISTLDLASLPSKCVPTHWPEAGVWACSTLSMCAHSYWQWQTLPLWGAVTEQEGLEQKHGVGWGLCYGGPGKSARASGTFKSDVSAVTRNKQFWVLALWKQSLNFLCGFQPDCFPSLPTRLHVDHFYSLGCRGVVLLVPGQSQWELFYM